MADEKPTLHIDTDWKKQAQEEKRRLAEEEQKRAAAVPPPAAAPAAPAGITPDSVAAQVGAKGTERGGREIPEASLAQLVQTLVTQALFYMGDLSVAGGAPNINLDMAKLQIDLLGVLEDKTTGNLAEDEKRILDAALYELRMRYVNVASQYI